ncbi:glycosyltransferase family 2 protein [Metabacillus elymi]|uniref:Glycosyltransferase n=1 Tax=Metabacillus elymi TaxID=2745198 RepID=A0ABX6RWX0_9BACI|nr:glycosyltransferase family 2 protein [Metabacillus sp. KUDC1714]QNF26190.1 glycosyltransferase [Metabacillus sp. KUDC1714]
MFPKVSVIVPVFNCEKFLYKCIESICKQTYSNIEIIVVNDGSTDNTEKIVLKMKEQENRIIYYKQENSGPSEARNKGISLSKGEYLIFIDSDDTVEPSYIEMLLNEMLISKADLVCCGYKDISEYGIVNYSDFHFNNSATVHSIMEMVCNGTGGVLWSKIFKKELISKNSLKMDKDIFMSEDLIFVLQYVSNCNSFALLNEYLYNYNRLNQGSISSNISIDYLQNYISVSKLLEKIFIEANFDKQKAKEVITKRIQEIVIKLVEQQSYHIKDITKKSSLLNVYRILSLNYISKYMDDFSTNKWRYKPFVFFVKKRFIRMSIIYGVYLNGLRCIKKKITSRKKVGL